MTPPTLTTAAGLSDMDALTGRARSFAGFLDDLAGAETPNMRWLREVAEARAEREARWAREDATDVSGGL
jgi:hypothetical protein